MAAVKKPCFNYQAATKGKEKDFGLTGKEARPLWEYAKKRYLDNGTSIEDTINALVKETGAPPRFWEEVFIGPKTSMRFKSKEMFAREDARRNAKYYAEDMIAHAQIPGLFRAIRTVGEFPRAALTAFHGGVFPVTHGGGLLLRPTAWGDFLRGAAVSWKTGGITGLPGPLGAKAAVARYGVERLKLQGEVMGGPRNRAAGYAEWRQAGLRIGVDERAQGVLSGWLSSRPGWSNRSWLGLMRMRYELADHMLKGYKFEGTEAGKLEKLEMMKKLAEIANHATGVSNIPLLGRYISKAAFAPQLTASKILRLTHDPYVTVRTAAKMITGKATTAGERAAMYYRTRNMAEFLGTWIAGLYINDAIIHHFGSKQRINAPGIPGFDMRRSDFLRFKSGDGLVLSSRGPEEVLRLFGELIAVGYAGKRELHGHRPIDEARDAIAQYLTYKVSPGFGTVGELGYGTDFFGRPLPPLIQSGRSVLGMPKQFARPGKPQYTNVEYAMAHAPIFLTGPARDIYQDMRERGMSEPDAKAIVHASLLTAFEFLGFGGYHETSHVTPKKGSQPIFPAQ